MINVNSEIVKLEKVICDCDAILVSASNGLSISEGYNIFAYDKKFQDYFSYFYDKYEISSIIQGIFFNFNLDDKRKFRNQLYKLLITDYVNNSLYKKILDIVINKPYFVITSNGDKHFELNGFKHVYEIEGNFFDLKVNSDVWLLQKRNFENFISKYKSKKVIQLELGIGSKNRLIKQPLMKLVEQNKNWIFVTFNLFNEINILPTIKNRSLIIEGDISENIDKLWTVIKESRK